MPAKSIACLFFAVLFIAGCDRVADIADRIPRYQFFEIGATEYELEMDRKDLKSHERKMAENIYPIDTQLTGLLRSLSVRDSYPPMSWKEGIMSEYFWLNEIVVMDKEQNVLSRHPETGIKMLSFEPVFPKALSLKQGKVMLAVEPTPLGSEILVVSAVYDDFELTGLIIVAFDPRTFIAQTSDPRDIILVCSEEIVWSGKYDQLKPDLQLIKWEEMVARRTSGKIKLGEAAFFWFARAVGEDWLFYLIEDQ